MYLLGSNAGLQTSNLTLVGTIFVICTCVLLICLPRHLGILPVILTACYMTYGQQLVLLGLHFTILRVLVIVGLLRAASRGELRSLTWHRLDLWVVLRGISGILLFTLLWQSGAALVNRLGVACDTAGLYFLFRILVRDENDVRAACKLFAVLLLPLALAMLCEWFLGGRNAFSALGGVPPYSEIRRGIVRCQGPFAHPILAGTFGAVWMPLFVGLWNQDSGRKQFAFIGGLSATIIMITSGSSGPILTYGAGLLGVFLWVARSQIRLLRWLVVVLIVAIQLVMNDPVWYLLARINVLSGSTGWHRAYLIDQTVRHFSDWWIFGAKDVGAWGVFAADITNQYILEAVNGGLLTACFFIGIIVVAYRTIGRIVRAARSNMRMRNRSKLAWAAGCALLAHCVTFMSVSYFDQNVVNFYLVLAMIPVLSTATVTSGAQPKVSTQRSVSANTSQLVR